MSRRAHAYARRERPGRAAYDSSVGTVVATAATSSTPGVVILFCAFAGLAFKREFDVTLKAGEAFKAIDPWGHQWRFVSEGVSRFDALNRQVTAVSLKPTRDGRPSPLIESEKRQHVDSRGNPTFEPSTAVGIFERPSQDVYVVFTGEIAA